MHGLPDREYAVYLGLTSARSTTPAAAYHARPKATPSTEPADRTHNRVRHDKANQGVVTLRHDGRLHHIGIGRALNGQPVVLLIQDLHITLVHATTGEHIRQLTLDPTRNYQPTRQRPEPSMRVRVFQMS